MSDSALRYVGPTDVDYAVASATYVDERAQQLRVDLAQVDGAFADRVSMGGMVTVDDAQQQLSTLLPASYLDTAAQSKILLSEVNEPGGPVRANSSGKIPSSYVPSGDRPGGSWVYNSPAVIGSLPNAYTGANTSFSNSVSLTANGSEATVYSTTLSSGGDDKCTVLVFGGIETITNSGNARMDFIARAGSVSGPVVAYSVAPPGRSHHYRHCMIPWPNDFTFSGTTAIYLRARIAYGSGRATATRTHAHAAIMSVPVY